MARRRTIAVAETLKHIVACTLPLTGAGTVAFIACGGSVHLSGSMSDASQADTQPDAVAVGAGDAYQADAQSEDSPTDSSDADTHGEDSAEAGNAGPLTCDVGYAYCCFNNCWCFVPPATTRWVACGADAEADADGCSSAQTPFQCSFAETETYCPRSEGGAQGCTVLGSEAGAVEVQCTWGPSICGRRPRGLAPGRILGGDPTVAYLATCAQLETASIDAFEILGRELEGLGAPRHLILAARRAAHDETRHARTMAALAHQRGSMSIPRKARTGARRSPRAIAIENAVEGCVRETYGAVVAIWQGQTAADIRIRRVMRRIGGDEARHAQLAWNIERWMNASLAPAARRAVKRARHDALETLRAELQQSPPPFVARALGLPSRAQAMSLLDLLARALTAWGAEERAKGPKPLARARRSHRGSIQTTAS